MNSIAQSKKNTMQYKTKMEIFALFILPLSTHLALSALHQMSPFTFQKKKKKRKLYKNPIQFRKIKINRRKQNSFAFILVSNILFYNSHNIPSFSTIVFLMCITMQCYSVSAVNVL